MKTEATEVSEALLPLRLRLADLDAAQSQLPDWDARRVGVTNASHVVLVALMQLSVLHHIEAEPKAAPVLFAVSGNISLAARMFARSARMTLCLEFQFQVENMLARLADALAIPKKDQRGGMEALANSVLARAGFPSHKHRAARMYLPSLMRNTLHNNGMHQSRSRQITAEGVVYRFRRNAPFGQAGWLDVTNVLSSEIAVLEELLLKPRIRRLPVIADPYAKLVHHGGLA